VVIRLQDIPYGPYRDWVQQYSKYLKNDLGLNTVLATKIAIMLLYSAVNGVTFSLSSGWRDPIVQAEMLQRWLAGNRSGLAAKPATNSKHTRITNDGKPNSMAIDITFSDQNKIGKWAKYFGLSWGGNFRSPDLVHFYIN